MRDDLLVTDLVIRVQHGDQHAWTVLVERYAPLVVSICRTYRLSRADTDDVAQTIWLRLVAQIGKLRDPAALAGWIATTTRRECARINRAARPFPATRWDAGTGDIPDSATEPAESQLLAAERRAALRQAFTCLPPSWQQLLVLLTEDPPVPYAQISAQLGIPIGSIGPTRQRCLQKLRHHPAIAHYSEDPDSSSRGRSNSGGRATTARSAQMTTGRSMSSGYRAIASTSSSAVAEASPSSAYRGSEVRISARGSAAPSRRSTRRISAWLGGSSR